MWLLTPDRDAKILHIASRREAEEFTREFALPPLPLPVKLRAGIGLLLTTALTDWARAFQSCDAIRLTALACDEVLYQRRRGHSLRHLALRVHALGHVEIHRRLPLK